MVNITANNIEIHETVEIGNNVKINCDTIKLGKFCKIGDNVTIDCKTFESFLEERHKYKDQKHMWHRAIKGWFNAIDYMKDDNGKVICDVMRFENYEKDINSDLGMPENFHIPPRNVTAINPGSYMDIYTPKTAQIVADWYKEDIEYFGFKFNSGATKNFWNDEKYKNNNI